MNGHVDRSEWLDTYLKRIVADAPPLPAETRDRLRELFRSARERAPKTCPEKPQEPI